jgi:hypothetical protein
VHALPTIKGLVVQAHAVLLLCCCAVQVVLLVVVLLVQLVVLLLVGAWTCWMGPWLSWQLAAAAASRAVRAPYR